MGPSVNLMTDVSQYIRAPEKPTDERIIDLQGEYFLGEQRNLEDWAQRSDFSTVVRVKPLKANSAGNILFADYQPHNPNVFSFHDPLNDIPAGTEIGYSVIGWHAGISEDPCMDKAPDITNGKLLAQLNMVLEKTKMDQAGVTKWTTSQDPARHICHGSTYSLLKRDPNSKTIDPGETGQSTWRPCGEWDDPVCGYIKYNSADLSLQVFTSAGDLRAEILTSEGNTATRVAHEDQPPMSDGLFEPPVTDTADQWKMDILDGFIQSLRTKHYALRMVEILGDAFSCMAPPAESYSSVMNAAFGRPFALAIAGWSIELNHEELQPQTSLRNLAGKSYSKLSDYDLPLHLGLKEYSDDGLAAYMPLRSDAPKQPDFGKIFTFSPSGVPEVGLNEDFACHPIHPIYPADPESPSCRLVPRWPPTGTQTGVLPPSSLALPDWAVQQALRKIRLCYRARPFLFQEDRLKSLNATAVEETPAPPAAGDWVHIPVVPYGKWSWLQPYLVEGDMKYCRRDVDKAEAKGAVLEVRKHPFTMADGIMAFTEPFLHDA
ncbi:hypothetical protein FVER53590_11077 [Fusarium verticillioides]|nr:hypothetical protein FVER53590_11077 [Fusarium verticillioides]